MPATKTQLIGGLFQDADGTVLNKGYLLFELSQDSQVTGLNTQVCAGVKIKITLAASGSIDTAVAQYIWGNDDLLPINSFYTVTGYTSAGQLAWGPNHQQVTSGTTFDVGTWVPDLLTNWQPPLQSPELQTNGADNGDQAKLNLKNGSNVTITDDGVGNVTIAATTSVALKVNGTTNVVQTLLDLEAGNGMTLTDEGDGGVQVDGVAIKVNGTPTASQTILNLQNGSNVTITDAGSGNVSIAAIPVPDNFQLRIFDQLWKPRSGNVASINFADCLSFGVINTSVTGAVGGSQTSPSVSSSLGYWSFGQVLLAANSTAGPDRWSGNSMKFLAKGRQRLNVSTPNFLDSFIGVTDNRSTTFSSPGGFNSSDISATNTFAFGTKKSLADNEWHAFVSNGSSTQILSTGISVTGFHTFEIDYVPGVSVTFFIDGVQVAQETTLINLPSTSVTVSMFEFISANAAHSGFMDMNYMLLKDTP